jgi:signal transduction histidine kinase
LPIRIRVTLAFAGVMAVVLTVIGAALYDQFRGHLDETLNHGLRSRAGDISALIQHESPSALSASGRRELVERGESFSQILEANGTVESASHPKLETVPLLTAAQIRRVDRGHTIILERPNPFEVSPPEPARVLATPVTARGKRLVVVVAAGADDRNSHLHDLVRLLLIGGPIALLLASLAGYGVASAALRPVEAMRRKATEITEDARGERLPVRAINDEIARLGTTLNDMLARLERAFDRERAFVSDASHELRTPLAILKTEIELALKGERSRDELVAALGSAAEETDRLAELAEALLVIARLDSGKLPLATTAVQTSKLLAGISVRFEQRVKASGRSLVVDEDGNATKLTCDPPRLEQALSNLVDNALLHGTGKIHLSAIVSDGRVELHVRDEGPGFPPQFLAEAFDRFTRADHARARGGSGLGLSIVREIARAHGGVARAANHADGGADVALDLPRDGPEGASS